jgi:hypothetical protein
MGVIRDCSEDGVLNGHYSHSDLTKALDKLPSDIDEYTDCRSVIRSAQLASAHKGKGGPRVDTTQPNPDEEKQLKDASRGGGGPLEVGGKNVVPGAGGASFKTAGFGTDLPPLVLAVLVCMALAGLAASAFALRRNPAAFARLGELPGMGGLAKILDRARDGVTRFRRR